MRRKFYFIQNKKFLTTENLLIDNFHGLPINVDFAGNTDKVEIQKFYKCFMDAAESLISSYKERKNFKEEIINNQFAFAFLCHAMIFVENHIDISKVNLDQFDIFYEKYPPQDSNQLNMTLIFSERIPEYGIAAKKKVYNFPCNYRYDECDEDFHFDVYYLPEMNEGGKNEENK